MSNVNPPFRSIVQAFISVFFICSLAINAANAGMYFVHSDPVGAPTKLSDSSKRVVWRAENRGYGENIVNDDVDGNGQKVTMPVRYPGQYFDAESGLHYNYFRYYDPKLGRYITSDPIGLAGGMNTYEYVRGNPVSKIDPWGLTDINYFNPQDDPILYAAANNTSPSGVFSVGGHGSPSVIQDPNKLFISPAQLAIIIQNHPNYKSGMPVALYSCNTGVSPNGGPSFASQLAKLLGATVVAPNNFAWGSSNGDWEIGPPIGGGDSQNQQNIKNGLDRQNLGGWHFYGSDGRLF